MPEAVPRVPPPPVPAVPALPGWAAPARTAAGAKLLLPVFLRPRRVLAFLRDGRASLPAKALMLAAIGYVLLPIDLVPDLAPIIGWLDDAGAVTASLAWVARRIAIYDQTGE